MTFSGMQPAPVVRFAGFSSFRSGESMRIEAQFTARGKSLLHLYGEAFNGKNSLAATASVNLPVHERGGAAKNRDLPSPPPQPPPFHHFSSI